MQLMKEGGKWELVSGFGSLLFDCFADLLFIVSLTTYSR
jgi:hypothetical protein